MTDSPVCTLPVRGLPVRRSFAVGFALAGLLAGSALAQSTTGPATPDDAAPAASPNGSRLTERLTNGVLDRFDRLRVTRSGRILEDTQRGQGNANGNGGLEGGGGGNCQQFASHEASNFQPGTYTLQAGFAQGEWFAASYSLPASAYPIKIDLIEALFATSAATVQTETRYTIRVWEGNPDNGTVVFEVSSDGTILPHVLVGPGTAATDLQFSIDPADPGQIIINNDGGSNIFSIGVRIDRHNDQTANPCFTPPPVHRNAFPCTDNTSIPCGTYPQLNSPSQNWLFGLNCGPDGCPSISDPNSVGAWSRFSNLAPDTNIFGICLPGCRPHGDWVIRATYESLSCQPGVGACCLPNGTCNILTTADCVAQSGLYRGDGSTCDSANCPQPLGACCFGTNCLNLSAADCAAAAGTYLGNGSTCASGNACPTGACCLPNGTCVIVTVDSCTAQSGIFRGVGTTCANANCPPPTGACCLASGGCLILTAAQCAIIPNSRFAGAGTNCTTGCRPPCRPDFNADGVLNSDDLSDFITCYFTVPACTGADYNNDTVVNSDDLADFITDYFNGC